MRFAMPQLPSGRHVGVSYDRLLQWAESVSFGELSEVLLALQSPDDLLILLDVLEYADPDNPPSAQDPAAGKPFLSPVRISELDTPTCPWPAEDQAALLDWLRGPRMVRIFERARSDLDAILPTRAIPEALRGILDGED